MCSQMPDTTKPMANPPSPDAKPPANAANIKSPRTTPSMAAPSQNGSERRLDGAFHLEGRPRYPLFSGVGCGSAHHGPANIGPLLAKETVLGLGKPGERGDRQGPRA